MSDAGGAVLGTSAAQISFSYPLPSEFGEGDANSSVRGSNAVGGSARFTQRFTVGARIPTTIPSVVVVPDFVGMTHAKALLAMPKGLSTGPLVDPVACTPDTTQDLVGSQEPPAGTTVNPRTDPIVTLTRSCVPTATLTVRPVGYDIGDVRSVPLGIDCPDGQCSLTADVGDSVTLRASRAATWSTCGAASTCVVTVSGGGTQVTVTFPDVSPPTVTLSGGGVTVTGDGADRSNTVSGAIDFNARTSDDSPVTTEIWTSLSSYSCSDGNIGRIRQALTARAPDGEGGSPISYSFQGAGCPSSLPIFSGATLTVYAIGRSEAPGKVQTGTIRITIPANP